MKAALKSLKSVGCRMVYLNGSFVSEKEYPNDYDACWAVDGVDPELLDPVFLDFAQKRAAQKTKYLGEFFPADIPEGLTGRTFLEFFQIDKETGRSKGIVGINLEEYPP